MTLASAAPDQDYEISDKTRLPDAPIVSVLMITYNHDEYLAQAIEGVLSQQLDFPIELLIGEDCSADDTRAIALRYQAAHPQIIRVISGSNNVGMHQNSERLIAASRGKFIAFCEGDDYWTDPLKLKLQVNFLLTQAEAGAVHSDFDHVLYRTGKWRSLSHFQRRNRRKVPEGKIFAALLSGNFIQTCTLCVRVELVREYLTSGLPVNTYAVGDWPFCLYIAARHDVGYLDRSTAAYRKVRGSAMNAGDRKRLSMVTSYESIIEDMCTYFSIQPAIKNAARASLYASMSKLAFLADDIPASEKCNRWLGLNAPLLHTRQRQLLLWAIHHRAVRSVFMRLIMLRRHLDEMVRYRSIK